MTDRLSAEIDKYFTPRRTVALVGAARDGYRRAVEHNSPEDGWDTQLFGFVIYKYVTWRLQHLLRDSSLGFELRSVHPAFRLGVGPFTLASYCCGYSGDQDINESFPNNEQGAPALVDVNQYCFDLSYEAATLPRALVLAHLGNSTNGLEALYLTAPASKEDNRIGSWSFTKLLWHWNQDGNLGVPPQLPPPAPIGPAPLSLKFPVEKRAGLNP